MDIALLPSHRGLGIGTHLFPQLIDEAKLSTNLLSIHVERLNPALNLYQRLDLRVAEDKGVSAARISPARRHHLSLPPTKN